MIRTGQIAGLAGLALALTVAAAPASAQGLTLAGSSTTGSAAARQYGRAVSLGQGAARMFVQVDQRTGAPLEVGIAFDEGALEGLPAGGAGHHGDHPDVHEYLFDIPDGVVAPFKFIEMNWNPDGHEPEGVYEGVPHFDFHFYTIPRAARDAIVPTDPQFEARANVLPAAEYVPAHNAILGPPGAPPAAMAVPMMGVHWVDLRSPELQRMLGNEQAHKPFTATFIHGSWDGRVIFWEPMITRAHLLAKKSATDDAVRDEIIPIPLPARYQEPGWYPTAYRITWDADTREYRIALTGLTRRD